MPEMFVAIFMLSLLSAAMSTAAAQSHTMGTAIGYHFYQQGLMKGKSTASTVHVTKLGIAFTTLVWVILAYILPGSIIARATAMFMGLCIWSFLCPSNIGVLFWKRQQVPGATASLVIGSISSLFWLVFVHAKEAVPWNLPGNLWKSGFTCRHRASCRPHSGRNPSLLPCPYCGKPYDTQILARVPEEGLQAKV